MAKQTSQTTQKAGAIKAKPTMSKGNATDLKERILAELSKFHRIKKYSAKTLTVAKACGFESVETKRFRIAKKELKDQGKITYSKDTMQLSQTSIDELKETMVDTDVKGASSNEEHHDMVKKIFENDKDYKNVCKLVDLLSDGKEMDVKKAANDMGYANIDSKGYRNAKNLLKSHGYLEQGGKGKIKLSDDMFPFGRPK